MEEEEDKEGEEQEEEEEVKGWELQTGGRRICSPARCNSEAFCQTTSSTGWSPPGQKGYIDKS